MQTILDTFIKLDDVGSLGAQKQEFERNLSDATSQILKDYNTAIKITWKMGVRDEKKVLPRMKAIDLIT